MWNREFSLFLPIHAISDNGLSWSALGYLLHIWRYLLLMSFVGTEWLWWNIWICQSHVLLLCARTWKCSYSPFLFELFLGNRWACFCLIVSHLSLSLVLSFHLLSVHVGEGGEKGIISPFTASLSYKVMWTIWWNSIINGVAVYQYLSSAFTTICTAAAVCT